MKLLTKSGTDFSTYELKQAQDTLTNKKGKQYE